MNTPPPGRLWSQCNCVGTKPRGKLYTYVYCSLPRNHETNDDDSHYDAQRDFIWHGPMLYWPDFEHVMVKAVEAPLKRKKHGCRNCGKYPCDCRLTAYNQTLELAYADELRWIDEIARKHGDAAEEMSWRMEFEAERAAIQEFG